MRLYSKNPGGEIRQFVKKRFFLPSLLALLHFTPHVNMDSARKILEQKEWENFQEEYAPLLNGYIKSVNSTLTPEEQENLVRAILWQSRELKIPDEFRIEGKPVDPVFYLTSLIQVESSFMRYAVSTSYALGYMQLKHPTARWLKEKSQDAPETTYLFYSQANIRLGVTYLNILFEEMGDLRKASLAYNAGATAVTNGHFDERYWEKIRTAYSDLERFSTVYPEEVTPEEGAEASSLTEEEAESDSDRIPDEVLALNTRDQACMSR